MIFVWEPCLILLVRWYQHMDDFGLLFFILRWPSCNTYVWATWLWWWCSRFFIFTSCMILGKIVQGLLHPRGLNVWKFCQILEKLFATFFTLKLNQIYAYVTFDTKWTCTRGVMFQIASPRPWNISVWSRWKFAKYFFESFA